MVRIDGGTHALGDPSPSPDHDTLVIPLQPVTVRAFCIARYPFPGQGAAWPEDGLGAGQVQAWDDQARSLGRRTCSVAELLVAAAGPDNREQAQDPALCEANDHTPGRIGALEACQTPDGVHDLGVRSQWGAMGALQDQFPRYVDWASWGRTSRTDTFYPATSWALHHHAVDEPGYLDDGWRSCADVGAASPDWAAFAAAFGGRFAEIVPLPSVQPEPLQDR